MTPDPFLAAPPIIQAHIVVAILALALGPVVLLRGPRDRLHKVMGYVWAAAMALTALSAMFIFQLRLIGPFSPIHLFVPVTLIGLGVGIGHARAGRRAAHRRTMMSLYVFAMGIPGMFTLLPGRIMNAIVFPAAPVAGFAASVALAGLAVALWGRRRPDRLRELLGMR